ncbi:cell wall hydrolase [Qipengyuania spongiae]|uniref:Cell wall hydrolase n=1 Tax=Qipengyuania spongiae TaxID=2909673 RepID=A0ABY5SZQ7_9SPHN|nr:cell wall hydrolase [Qipengyuania spongiae]UVI39997.1 cell wall hydrolase [Qipengyuania spongiae]
MVRKSVTAALVAVGMIFTIANVEGSDAVAQVTVGSLEISPAGDAATEELVPVFVESEVVQPLPEDAPKAITLGHSHSSDTPPSAATLRELVAITPTDEAMSDELRCLAGAIYFESRGEPLAGQLAVARVIINRTESGRFPSSYCGVVTQRSQFSFVRNGRIPEPRTSSAAWRRAVAIAQIAHQNRWDSEAGDSLYFHAKYVRPSWSRSKVATATIDSHIFYR